MRTVFSLVYWFLLAASSILGFSISLAIVILTFPFDRRGVIIHLWSCLWAQSYIRLNPFWHGTIDGREKCPSRGAAVIVSNHQSLGDILVLYGLYRPFKWVSKRSLFAIPFIGWNMILNRYVALKRGDRESILAMYRACERWLDRGMPVLIFPEGTRSPDGTVRDFKDGAFKLAISKQCPVIPIAISGTGTLLPKHGFVLRGRGVYRARVLDPVDPSKFPDAAAMRDHVRAAIVAEKARLDASLVG